MRALCKAGARPNKTPVATAINKLKSRTLVSGVRLRGIAVAPVDAHLGRTRVHQNATAMPRIPPLVESRRHSVNVWRTRRVRLALSKVAEHERVRGQPICQEQVGDIGTRNQQHHCRHSH